MRAPTETGTARARAEPDVWPLLDDEALHGLPGDVVRVIGPHTESDHVALLVSYLVGFGNAAGAGPHVMVEAARHPARLFAVVCGATSKARKGTSWRNVRRLLVAADPRWESQVRNGLSSGEGVIVAVQNPEYDDQGRVVVPGASDKRLLVVEEEFAQVLTRAGREGNTLSPIIRSAFDDGVLRTMTIQPRVATDTHISVIAHITIEELRKRLVETDVLNGFANRFLFVAARRSKKLALGGRVDDEAFAGLVRQTRDVLVAARQFSTVRFALDAEARWWQLYEEMGNDTPGGLFGAAVARAEALVLRLAVAYALTDGSRTIELAHLGAAWALWRYCRASAQLVFTGGETGDEIADKLLAAIRASGPAGLGRKDQSDVFGGHVSAKRLDACRDLLVGGNLVRPATRGGRGRPASVLVAVEHGGGR